MKRIWISGLLLCLCLLAGCGAEKEITGEVMEVQIDEAAGTGAYVLLTEKGDTVGLTANSGTVLHSWVDTFDEEAFLAGEQRGVVVRAYCGRNRTKLLTQDGKEIKAYPATNIAVEGMVTRDAYTLSDGTALTRRDTLFDRFSYELPDGTELLWGEVPDPADDAANGALENRTNLSEAVKKAISAYFEEHKLYDLDQSLENAYADHLNAEETGREFRSHVMMQENRISGSNGSYIAVAICSTTPAEPHYTGIVVEDERFAIFDTQTGEQVSLWDLFRVPEAEARLALGAHCIADNVPITAEEYGAAIDPERVSWSPERLEIRFPAGSLPEREHTVYVSIDLVELESVLTEQALAKGAE